MKRLPMTDRLVFGARRMNMAAAAADWEGVASEAAALGQLADTLIGHARWQAAETRALEALIVAMRHALDAVEREREHIAESMVQFNRQRAAWMAYARHGDAPEPAT